MLESLPYVDHVMPCETNILIFTLGEKYTEKEFLAKLKDKDIHAMSLAPQVIRFVTHLDFTDSMMMNVEDVLKQL